MEGSRLTFRLIILGFITIVLAAAMVGTLFNLQMVAALPEKTLASERRYTEDVSVVAARGEVRDRYGRPLITNELSHNIVLNVKQLESADRDLLAPGRSSQALLDLVALCRETNTTLEEQLPVTLFPYHYQADMTTNQKRRLTNFLTLIEKPEMTASELIAYLRERYTVPSHWGEDDARLVVGLRYEAELRVLFPTIAPYVPAKHITTDLKIMVEERALTGISVVETTSRAYQTDYAAHLLGRTGPIFEDQYQTLKDKGYALDAIIGKDGLEEAAETWLRGISGQMRVETDVEGRITNQTYLTQPVAGNHLLTTLDLRLQEATERSLERGILALRQNPEMTGGLSQGGAAVVIDVNTGEVLAMASYPTFQLKAFNQQYDTMMQDPLTPMVNRAISGAYEPGSIFKMCTGIAALEEGIITTRTRIVDKGRYMYYAPTYTPVCHIFSSGATHGSVDVANALRVSCNYFFYETGRLLGIDKLAEYAANFGLAQKTGIEISGERLGSLASPAYTAAHDMPWNPGDTIQSAIGQSYNNFTPLQMAVYTATVANGGIHYRPHLLKSVRTYDYQRTAFDILPEVLYDFHFTPENIQAVQRGMRMVASPGGTGYRAFEGFDIAVAAKTGTAQTIAGRPNNGVFVAYAPYEKPEIAIAVVVEKGAGGSRVAPIARDIFEAYFDIQSRMKEK